jgi:hypothetical protein
MIEPILSLTQGLAVVPYSLPDFAGICNEGGSFLSRCGLRFPARTFRAEEKTVQRQQKPLLDATC